MFQLICSRHQWHYKNEIIYKNAFALSSISICSKQLWGIEAVTVTHQIQHLIEQES